MVYSRQQVRSRSGLYRNRPERRKPRLHSESYISTVRFSHWNPSVLFLTELPSSRDSWAQEFSEKASAGAFSPLQ